jgi:hypothetical protein
MQRMLDPAKNPLLAGGQAHQVRPGSIAPSGGSWTKASARRAAFSTAITKHTRSGLRPGNGLLDRYT